MESVLTEILILFVIRTQRPFFRSRPAWPLLLLGILAIFFTMILPWSPFAPPFGFVPLPASMAGGLLLILSTYLISADWLKIWFFRSMH